ncbi:N-acetylglucosamine-6-phosphate deacetylase [Pasteurellaceae bacterium TAE3-ERU1]|nr:N-acetylglucosamine-6-phosphate deacetylase [Pasteurellaceae bacterium TAE3-ERU1]
MAQFYTGARVFDRGALLEHYALVVDGGKTQKLVPESAIPEGAQVKRLNGGILTPGFVETQANGGGGVLVNDQCDRAGLEKVLAGHRKYGTVAMLPTFITDSQEKYHQAIANVANLVKEGMKGLVGGHFEGPFLCVEKKGTHNPRYIRIPDEKDFACYEQHADYLQHSILSLAPEQVPAGTIARIKPFIPQINLAHSMATAEDLLAARAEGLTGITHLYNAMRPLSGRDPGPIGSAVELGLYAGIIADGVHSSPYSLATAYQLLGDQHLMLVTDSMHTIGAPEITEFDLMGVKVFVKEDRLVNEHGSLAGAHINLLQCVQNAVRYMHADIRSALRMAVSTPANYVGRADLATIVARDVDDVIYLSDGDLALRDWQ